MAAVAVAVLGVGTAAVVIESGTAQAASPQDCGLQRDLFGASAQCPVGQGWFYELSVECFGLNMPFARPPAIGPYTQTISTLAAGPNISASCNSGGAAIAGVVTNAYISPHQLWRD
ncbi:hypothetical protein [Nocardia sp.]|uniref:hypothetical protein n=1 Tax=Nocardia sp. TaxID=1821 RepID=UPI00260394E7|nr:hypothetical protein [Nocardia sp.]